MELRDRSFIDAAAGNSAFSYLFFLLINKILRDARRGGVTRHFVDRHGDVTSKSDSDALRYLGGVVGVLVFGRSCVVSKVENPGGNEGE